MALDPTAALVLEAINWFLFVSVLLTDGSFMLERYASIKGEILIWPPPSDQSWQKKYINFVFGYAQVATPFVAVIDRILSINRFGIDLWIRLSIGIPMLAFGGIFAIWGAWKLSWYQSLGGVNKLRTEGPYKYSRNPQYTGGILAYMSAPILADSWRGLIVAVFISLWFWLAPRTEEPWLHAQFGKAYEEYANKTPRFLFKKKFVHTEEKGEVRFDQERAAKARAEKETDAS